MKIEEAIVYCLATSNRGMRSEQIADMIKGCCGYIICRSGNRSKNAAWLSRDTLHSVKWLPADEGILEKIENLIS